MVPNAMTPFWKTHPCSTQCLAPKTATQNDPISANYGSQYYNNNCSENPMTPFFYSTPLPVPNGPIWWLCWYPMTPFFGLTVIQKILRKVNTKEKWIKMTCARTRAISCRCRIPSNFSFAIILDHWPFVWYPTKSPNRVYTVIFLVQLLLWLVIPVTASTHDLFHSHLEF